MADGEMDGLGDDQGTRVGSPEQGKSSPAKHSDAPTGRPERSLGTGAEATRPTGGTAEGHDEEHKSGYGGDGGEPKGK